MAERENKEFVLLFVILLLIVSVLPQLAKLSFVHPTGNIKILGLPFGVLLSLSIFFKWKFARALFYISFVPVLILDILLVIFAERMFVWNFVFLSLCHAVIVYVFYASKNIRVYLGGSRQEAVVQEAEGEF